MLIERVNIDDVYPVEDEYGNQYLSRDYSLKSNKDYVTQLAASFGENGEPTEPPVLVRDGGIYRIKAGNSRIMAMRELGTKAFNAIIDETDTPQSLVEAAIRTDTKKTYETIERSRFEQQLYLFADDEYVSKATGRSVDEVKKVRRTLQSVEDAAEDMTIERMIALAEFENEDPEVYQAIAYASEADWRRIAFNAKAQKESREKADAIKSTLISRGAVMSTYEELSEANDLIKVSTIYSASDVPDELPQGTMFCETDYMADYFYVYCPKSEDDRAREIEQQAILENENKFRSIIDRRTQWLVEHINDELNEIYELAEPYAGIDYRTKSFFEKHEMDLPRSPIEIVDTFMSYSRCYPFDGYGFFNPGDYMVFQDALVACGYEPSEDEVAFYELAKHNLEEGVE